jgi:hypothetical protein|tara:strand:- start:83 stop:910 length:828 start_codon:yes stop_codon:yes gene_type:complete
MLNKLIFILFYSTSIIFSQNWVTQLNKDYSPAVVIVGNQQNGVVVGFGSGFNINKNGLIVTNYHVVKEADKILVKFKNGDEFEGQYYSYVDEEKDFVIIKIPGFDLPTAKLGNSNKVDIGNEVIAIGNPWGAWHSVTKGIISQKVDFGGYKMFQTDVSIAKGSSGGPLFNNKKEIIGVTTSGYEEGLGINYAIPINYLRGPLRGGIYSLDFKSKKSIGFDIKKVAYSQPYNDNNKSTASVVESTNNEDEGSNILCGSIVCAIFLYCSYPLLLILF